MYRYIIYCYVRNVAKKEGLAGLIWRKKISIDCGCSMIESHHYSDMYICEMKEKVWDGIEARAGMHRKHVP